MAFGVKEYMHIIMIQELIMHGEQALKRQLTIMIKHIILIYEIYQVHTTS